MSPISPISVVGAAVAFPARCRPCPVEPTYPKQADPGPANPFTAGPIPFDRFLEKLNALDRFDRDLPPLLEGCGRLLVEGGGFLIVTCHSPGPSPSMLSDQFRARLKPAANCNIEAQDLWVPTANGRRLHSGTMVR